MAVAVFKTSGFIGNAIRFSPLIRHRVAVATTQNSDVGGRIGRQYVLELTTNGIVEVCSYYNSSELYDCAFSEQHANILVSGCGDGKVKVWDTDIPSPRNPIRSLNEHSCAVYWVDWNPLQTDCFLTGSWDHTIKLWKADLPHSVRTYNQPSNSIFGTISWHPKHAHMFASSAGDSNVSIWDVRVTHHAALVIPAHDGEVIACDWSISEDTIFATGSTDKTLKLWDIRFPLVEFKVLGVHEDSVKSVRFSKRENLLLSCSGTTVCRWKDFISDDVVIQRTNYHTECVLGIDVSKLVEGLFASTGADERVIVWEGNSGAAVHQ